MEKQSWKIGEISEKTEVTIRALHHYHDIGLLVPENMTAAGHRLYTKCDIIRLQKIISLKQFGFKLDKIMTILDTKDFEPLEIIRMQIQVIEENLASHKKLKAQLETIMSILLKNEAKIDDFFNLIGVINMDKIVLEVGTKLVPLVDKEMGSNLTERINDLRKNLSFPPVRIRDNNMLEGSEYRILINGNEVLREYILEKTDLIQENIEKILANLRKLIESNIEELL